MKEREDLRPDWARALDRLVVRLARLLGHLVRRPSEPVLASLAGRQRPTAVVVQVTPLEAGRSALAKGLYADALHEFGRLLSVAPEHAWAWHGRGDALQMMGEFSDALDAYEKACALQPEVGLHHGGRANALNGLGRQEESKTAFSVALELDPELRWMRSTKER